MIPEIKARETTSVSKQQQQQKKQALSCSGVHISDRQLSSTQDKIIRKRALIHLCVNLRQLNLLYCLMKEQASPSSSWRSGDYCDNHWITLIHTQCPKRHYLFPYTPGQLLLYLQHLGLIHLHRNFLAGVAAFWLSGCQHLGVHGGGRVGGLPLSWMRAGIAWLDIGWCQQGNTRVGRCKSWRCHK